MGNLGHIIGDGGHARVIRHECGDAHVIGIGNNKLRRKVDLLEMPDEEWGTAIAGAPPCFNADPEVIGPGTVVLRGAVLGPDVHIGRHCIINHNAVVDHDCVLHDYVHVAPGAVISGGATIGEGALIGPGASVGIGAAVPPWAIVRANSVFPHDYYGYNPRHTGTRKLRTLLFDHPVDWKV